MDSGNGGTKRSTHSSKRTPLQQDLKLFQSIYEKDLAIIYSRKSSASHGNSSSTSGPSQGFLSAAHDLVKKYMDEKIYYNDKTYVKLWLLFAAHVEHFRGELDLGTLQSSLVAAIATPTSSGHGLPSSATTTKKIVLKTGENVTPGTIYQHMFQLKIGKYLSLFYLTAANYFESIQEYPFF